MMFGQSFGGRINSILLLDYLTQIGFGFVERVAQIQFLRFLGRLIIVSQQPCNSTSLLRPPHGRGTSFLG